jgi:hypothetical protein
MWGKGLGLEDDTLRALLFSHDLCYFLYVLLMETRMRYPTLVYFLYITKGDVDRGIVSAR